MTLNAGFYSNVLNTKLLFSKRQTIVVEKDRWLPGVTGGERTGFLSSSCRGAFWSDRIVMHPDLSRWWFHKCTRAKTQRTMHQKKKCPAYVSAYFLAAGI